MPIRVINIIDRFDAVNFGIWNAACATAQQLEFCHGIRSELWFPATDYDPQQPIHCELRPLPSTTLATLAALAAQLTPHNTIIVTHGCWQYPTRWGAALARKGFTWVYVPHGMLEPWSLSQKKWVKKAYWHLSESRNARHAKYVRAVGKPEYENLVNLFKNKVILQPNCVPSISLDSFDEKKQPRIVLFMARMHKKKNIMPLLRAWASSQLMDNPHWQLWLAGPDDGELPKILEFLLQRPGNIQYIGARYGYDKTATLQAAQFYILPSLSEGFPTSVVEAGIFGLLPLISEGCNFPELFSENLALNTGYTEESILHTLNTIAQLSNHELSIWRTKIHNYIASHYTDTALADQQTEFYTKILE